MSTNLLYYMIVVLTINSVKFTGYLYKKMFFCNLFEKILRNFDYKNKVVNTLLALFYVHFKSIFFIKYIYFDLKIFIEVNQ